MEEDKKKASRIAKFAPIAKRSWRRHRLQPHLAKLCLIGNLRKSHQRTPRIGSTALNLQPIVSRSIRIHRPSAGCSIFAHPKDTLNRINLPNRRCPSVMSAPVERSWFDYAILVGIVALIIIVILVRFYFFFALSV